MKTKKKTLNRRNIGQSTAYIYFGVKCYREHTKAFLQEAINALRDIFLDFPAPASTGEFDEAFHLRVTREGCEFDGEVGPGSDTVLKLLSEWLKNVTCQVTEM